MTLLMVGVGLESRGLFSEGDSYDDAPLAQTARRTTKLDMQPFLIDTDRQRREWRQLLLATERKLALADKFPACSPTSCRTTFSPAPPGTSAR